MRSDHCRFFFLSVSGAYAQNACACGKSRQLRISC
ncbi:eukaryotic initiation factor 5a, putative [Leishmania donovani]|uniref:Eukaryotic initiation factor 5a, putative n=1 Tax=Leishmania donovani TaxID=5661 RepID=E9BHI0_LEIDO|nr:eukaryotic initiation factor 5a, putative [Leishmania donovani]CBZ34706.1 eukaryotic initiation factor 5a, putative [Leishmania donovani]